MKTLRNTTRLATLLLLIASLFVLASCFPGSLEMQSMTLDPNSVKTSYIVGDELDLSGMKVSVVYNDETLNKVYTYDELTVDVPDDATATTGAKTVTVSFKDPNLDGKVQKITFQIYVNPDPNAELPGDEKSEIVLFEKPDALIDFLASNTAEGKVNYGEPGFLGQFIHTKDYYTVGDDNIFKFNPDVKVLVDGIPAAVTSFFGDVTVSVKGEEGYETLVAVADPVNVNTVKYYLGSEAAENLIVTVDTYKGEYQFTPAAVGKVVKISMSSTLRPSPPSRLRPRSSTPTTYIAPTSSLSSTTRMRIICASATAAAPSTGLPSSWKRDFPVSPLRVSFCTAISL